MSETDIFDSSVDLVQGGKGDIDVADKQEARSWLLQPRVWQAIALGQFLALMITASGITSSYIAERGISLPQFQGWLNYICLSLVYTPILVYRGHFAKAVSQYGWLKYFVLALVDVEANYMIVLAYQYASITSIQLLDNFTVPAVMGLSLFVLNITYRTTHVVGACVCLSGVITLVLYDYFTKGDTDAVNALLGDLLVIAASTLYAVSNVAQEFLIRGDVTVVEWLAMIGLNGTVIGGIQFAVLEGSLIQSVVFDGATIALFAGFTASMVIFYSLVPVLIRISSATMLNLSLLTCDFYSVFAGVFLFSVVFTPVYALAFLLSASGILIYNCVHEPVASSGRPPVVRALQKVKGLFGG